MVFSNEEVMRMTEIALQKYHITQKSGAGDGLYLGGFIEITFEFHMITNVYQNGFIDIPFDFYDIEVLE